MSTLSRRIIRVLPGWAWQLWQYRPVLMTVASLRRHIDKAEIAAFADGMRAERDETERVARDLAARIDAGPLASDRFTGRAVPARRSALRLIPGGVA